MSCDVINLLQDKSHHGIRAGFAEDFLQNVPGRMRRRGAADVRRRVGRWRARRR